MELGIVGLGRMGGGMVRRLLRDGHRVVAYDIDHEKTQEAAVWGAVGASSLGQVAEKLPPTRAIWLMVPAGEAVDQAIAGLVPHLAPGDIIIDGGNSYYRDSLRRGEALRERGFRFVDVGTSGGLWGQEAGYCLMVGGEEEVFHRLEPIFQSLAMADGYAYVGPAGAGHFVKMVHNGIEYGLLQAYAEGFELLEAAPYSLDLSGLARLWNHGGVVRSWLLELVESALRKDPTLASIKGYVEDTGEGRWMVAEAIERDVPVPVIALSLLARLRSRQEDSFAARVIAALRREFGGHAVVSE